MPLIYTPDRDARIGPRQAPRTRHTKLSPGQVARAGAAAEWFARSPEFARAQRIADDVSMCGEADPRTALEAAIASAKTVYLSRVTVRKELAFEPWRPGVKMRNNRFGMPKPPPSTRAVAPDTLDLAIVPFVAFDATGMRLGSDAGYYDRAFAFRRASSRPILAGSAYAFRQRPRLPPAAWDVPLDLVVTERGIRRFHSGNDS